MALILKRLLQHYRYAVLDLADPRTADFLLVKSPIQVVFLVVAYLMIVKDVVPRFVKQREAYNLRWPLLGYNLCKLAVNAYMLYQVLPHFRYINLGCADAVSPGSPVGYTLARLVWTYFLDKLTDTFYTMIMAFNKRDDQLGFLHVYRRCAMILASYVFTKYAPGGHTVFLGLLDVSVQVLAYSYHLAKLSSGSFKNAKVENWLQKGQLIQLVVVLVWAVQLLFRSTCTCPKMPLLVVLPQALMLQPLYEKWKFGDQKKIN